MKNLAGLAGQTRAGQAIGRVGLAIQRAARKSMRYVTGKCGCFTAMTLVWTANGAVPIVDIEEGQQVLAAPDDGLATSYSSNTVATKIIVGQASLVQLLVLHEDGSSELISTTDEHPFHVADTAKWTRADGLRIGDHLSTITGTSKLQGVIYTTKRVPVYNLSIPGSPTYYIGEHGVWVHNAACKLPKIDFDGVRSGIPAWDRFSRRALQGVADGTHSGSRIMANAMSDASLQAVRTGSWFKHQASVTLSSGKRLIVHYSEHANTKIRWDVKIINIK